MKYFYLASVGLYVTSYLSTGIACWSTEVCHDIFTDVGFKNVTVIFSGAAEIEPENRKINGNFNAKYLYSMAINAEKNGHAICVVYCIDSIHFLGKWKLNFHQILFECLIDAGEAFTLLWLTHSMFTCSVTWIFIIRDRVIDCEKREGELPLLRQCAFFL